MNGYRQDLTGQKFYFLTALHHVEGRRWMFQCECGETAVLPSNSVKSGNTKSCGCLKTRAGVGATNRKGGVNRQALPFFERLSWDERPISSWAKHYDTTPAEIMQRLKRDKTL